MIDSHAHYDNNRFDTDRDEILQQAFSTGVTHIINPGCDVESSRMAIAMADRYPGMFAAVGFHPHDASSCTEEALVTLETLCAHKKVVAIGEIGLDYHYDYSPREVQKQVLRHHFSLARRVGKPVILHDREAHRDIMDLVKEERADQLGGVFHCWSGSVELAREALHMGFYIGLGGSVTFRNAKRLLEVARMIPKDRLLIETDCPYLAPEPHRGRRNWSGLMVHVLDKLAEIRETTASVIEHETSENARRLFNLPEATEM